MRFAASAAEFRESYLGALREELRREDPRRRVMPGVRELLLALSGRPDVHLGLLTGNIEELRRTTRAVQPHEAAKEAHAASAAKKDRPEEPKRYQHRDHEDQKPSKL